MAIHPYWEPPHGMVMDVEHMDDSAVCSSTITYMLDGNRGLLADLALIAQAAALAREVRTFPLKTKSKLRLGPFIAESYLLH